MIASSTIILHTSPLLEYFNAILSQCGTTVNAAAAQAKKDLFPAILTGMEIFPQLFTARGYP